MAFRHLALALGIFAYLFVAGCGSTAPGTLDTDSPAMPWEPPTEEDLVGDDGTSEPEEEFPVPDLPLDDDDDDSADTGDGTPADPTAASEPATDTKAAEPAPKKPKAP